MLRGPAGGKQRHRTVGLGLLGQIVEDGGRAALVHPVLADSGAVNGHVLGQPAGSRPGGDDGRVLMAPASSSVERLRRRGRTRFWPIAT